MNVPSALPQAVKGGGRSDGLAMAESLAAVSPWRDSAPAAVFLKSSAPGAYTTTRTGNDGEFLLLWHRHLRRLAQSMEVLSLAMPDRFPPPLKSVGRLQDLVMPSLQAGLRRAWTRQRSGEELNVTVLVSPDDACARLSWNASVHLEKAKPVGATEIMLSNDGDGLLEGSVTNFFVVAMTPDMDVEVQTAAVGDGVLPGVIRQLVVEVCEEDGIPIREVMPSWQSRGTWTEAFVTSSLPMVQAVESIRRCHPANRLETREWTEVRFERPANVTATAFCNGQ